MSSSATTASAANENGETEFPCPYAENSQNPDGHKCKGVKKNKKLLRRHILRTHLKSLNCSVCFKRFGTNYEKKRHKIRFHCKRERIEPDITKDVLDLVHKLKSCKTWDDMKNVLFPGGKCAYDYESKNADPKHAEFKPPDYPASPMDVTSSPVTGSPSDAHPNELNFNSTTGHPTDFDCSIWNNDQVLAPDVISPADIDFSPGPYSAETSPGVGEPTLDGAYPRPIGGHVPLADMSGSLSGDGPDNPMHWNNGSSGARYSLGHNCNSATNSSFLYHADFNSPNQSYGGVYNGVDAGDTCFTLEDPFYFTDMLRKSIPNLAGPATTTSSVAPFHDTYYDMNSEDDPTNIFIPGFELNPDIGE